MNQDEHAAVLIEESLERHRVLGHVRGVAYCQVVLSGVARRRGAADQSTSLASEALVGFRSIGDTFGSQWAVAYLGLAEQLSGHSARAVRLLGAAESLSEATGASVLTFTPLIRDEYDRCLTQARAALPPRQFAAAWDAGKRMSIQEAIEDALNVDPHAGSNVSRMIRLAVLPAPQPELTEPLSDAGTLTERELEVLQLLARGLTSKEIASTLMVSVRTVEHHRASVSAKLGARNRAELVEHAVRRGWVVNR